MEERNDIWTRLEAKLPEVGRYVLVSVRDGNYCYVDVAKLDEDGTWSYHNDVKLPDNIILLGWMKTPPALIN